MLRFLAFYRVGFVPLNGSASNIISVPCRPLSTQATGPFGILETPLPSELHGGCLLFGGTLGLGGVGDVHASHFIR